MAKQVLTDAYLSIGGTDYSAWVKSITLTYSVDEVDQTTMGDGTHTFLPGLKSWGLDVGFAQDWVNAGLDDYIFANLGVALAIEVRKSKATAVGPDNPKYTGSAFPSSHSPIAAGSVGALAETSVKFAPTTVLTRAEA